MNNKISETIENSSDQSLVEFNIHLQVCDAKLVSVALRDNIKETINFSVSLSGLNQIEFKCSLST